MLTCDRMNIQYVCILLKISYLYINNYIGLCVLLYHNQPPFSAKKLLLHPRLLPSFLFFDWTLDPPLFPFGSNLVARAVLDAFRYDPYALLVYRRLRPAALQVAPQLRVRPVAHQSRLHLTVKLFNVISIFHFFARPKSPNNQLCILIITI